MSIHIGFYAVTGTYVISNSKDPEGPEVEFTRDEVIDFLRSVKKGELDKHFPGAEEPQ